MKKTFLYFCLLFIVQTAFAADSLYVREQQIPILIDRIDNVLYEMRIPAQKGDVLNEITIQIGSSIPQRGTFQSRYVHIQPYTGKYP